MHDEPACVWTAFVIVCLPGSIFKLTNEPKNIFYSMKQKLNVPLREFNVPHYSKYLTWLNILGDPPTHPK